MPITSRRKRRVFGAIRDFDENFLELRNDSDDDRDIDRDSESSKCGSNNLDAGDNSCSDDSEFHDEEYYSVDQLKNPRTRRKKTSGVPSEKRANAESGGAVKVAKRKHNSKRDAAFEKKEISTKDRKTDDTTKEVSVKVESDDDNEEKTSERQKKRVMLGSDLFDVVLPSSILNGGGGSSENQCTLLVEVSNSKDAVALGEFGGSIGAIGRFESDQNGITLDLKGNQYRGSLLPGPTCFVVGFPQSFGIKKKEPSQEANGEQVKEKEAGKLRVEGIADEYATLVQIDDHMKKLDAIVIETRNDNNKGTVTSDN